MEVCVFFFTHPPEDQKVSPAGYLLLLLTRDDNYAREQGVSRRLPLRDKKPPINFTRVELRGYIR